MKLTKYSHACFAIEQDGQIVVVDPGNWSADFIVPDHVVGIVITHEHADHFDREHIAAIVDKNPDAVIISHQSVIKQITGYHTQVVAAGDTVAAGPFSLEFFGGQHAVITNNLPIIENLGVLINSSVYYPGDSFNTPNKPVDTLALPVSAPWLKFSEAADLLASIRPRFVFPTHDAILSDEGKSLVDRLAGNAAEQCGAVYQRINGETISV